MNSLVVSGSVLLVLLLLVILWRRSKRGKAEPYELQETLFSPAERAFLGVLDLAVGDQARVFAKVRVADVLTPQARLGKGKWQQAFDMISAKRFDYLLCHPTDLSFLCAVELDDSAHRHQKRKVRDLLLKSACDSAGLPLLQIPASSRGAARAVAAPAGQDEPSGGGSVAGGAPRADLQPLAARWGGLECLPPRGAHAQGATGRAAPA